MHDKTAGVRARARGSCPCSAGGPMPVAYLRDPHPPSPLARCILSTVYRLTAVSSRHPGKPE